MSEFFFIEGLTYFPLGTKIELEAQVSLYRSPDINKSS